MSKFNAEMLILAREARQLSQKELAAKIGVKQGTLSKMENELLDLEEHIPKLCEVLDFPESFFQQKGGRYEVSAHHYRKKVSIPNKELARIKAIINILKMNIEKFMLSVDVPAERLPKWDVEHDGSPSMYANYIREFWRLPKGRVENLTRLAEDNGIIVIHVDFGFAAFDGLSMYTEANQAVVFLNKNSSGDRLRLTLAHEIGHLGMHFTKIVSNERNAEKEAMEFASELLVPKVEIFPHLSRLNLEKLADLKRYWRVSMASILYKAKDLGFNNSYRYMWTQFRKLKYDVQEPKEISVPVEKPYLVKEILDAFIEDLSYSKEDLGKMLSLNESDLNDLYFPSKVKLRVLRAA